MRNTFRRQCASALMHPATLAAVAVLLANDIVFKSLWPGAWLTGKFSDLAWMIFAPPLLAFLLSFAAGRHATAQRTAFLTAYVGLPLLYAAFNTFTPVHDGILRGISLVSGGTAGSPLDATDSIVIPLAISIAIWVWHAPVPDAGSLRLRWGLLAAAVAALASIATSYPDQEIGVRDLSISADGTVYASNFQSYATFRSSDGGLTWTRADAPRNEVVQGAGSIQTPMGDYTIRDSGIWLLGADGGEELAYSTSYLGREGNVWVQEHATTHLSVREITTMPYDMVYDERSGNVIAAMGIQGVLVGAPGGRWSPVAVGWYTPTDFSFSGKTRQLLSNAGFLAVMLALALTMTGLSLLASTHGMTGAAAAPPRLLPPGSKARKCSWVALGVAAPGLLALIVFGIPMPLMLLALVFALLAGAVRIGSLPPESNVRQVWGWGLGICSFLASGGFLFVFGGSDVDAFSNYAVQQLAFGIPAFVLGIAALAVSWQQFRQWRVVGPAFLGMNALVVLAFMLWLHLGIVLFFAKLAALILTGALAFVLAGHVRQMQQPR